MKIPEQAQSWKKSLLDLTQANLVTGRTRFSLTTVVLKISIKSMKLEMSSILFLYVFDVLQCTLPPSRCWVYPRSKDMPSQHDAEMPDGYLNVWCKWRCKSSAMNQPILKMAVFILLKILFFIMIHLSLKLSNQTPSNLLLMPLFYCCQSKSFNDNFSLAASSNR